MKFDKTRFMAKTHHFDLALMIFSISVVPTYPDLNPFDTICVSVTPSPPGSYLGSGDPSESY